MSIQTVLTGRSIPAEKGTEKEKRGERKTRRKKKSTKFLS
jgi:hypothetical protein